ncbi:MAG: ATP phosphoribosyltransferase [Pseudomonadota bacterium]
MTPLILAIPSKGRLQDNALAFLTRAGLKVNRPRGGREYRGAVAGLPGVEVAFLSASEIARELAEGRAHMGLTGLDLIHETVDDEGDRTARLHIITPLGFGPADVVVAVPESWIDVDTMADLADVAERHRARHGTTLRVATKFFNLTRRHFAAHGVEDYRIVESAGATEGAPAAGTADLIVDITTTGATLTANQLKILADDPILTSEASFVASRRAAWSADLVALAVTITDRIAAELRASDILELRAVVPDAQTIFAEAQANFAARTPFGIEATPLTLHVARRRASQCAAWLRLKGAQTVVIAQVSDVYEPNPLSQQLSEALRSA